MYIFQIHIQLLRWQLIIWNDSQKNKKNKELTVRSWIYSSTFMTRAEWKIRIGETQLNTMQPCNEEIQNSNSSDHNEYIIPPICHLNKTLQARSNYMPGVGTTIMRDIKFIDSSTSLLMYHISYMVQVYWTYTIKKERTSQHYTSSTL